MDYRFSEELQQLRQQLRDRIVAAFPDGFPTIFNYEAEPLEASHEFCRRLGDDSLMAIAWPKEYGGHDASLWAQMVVAEEMWAHNEPRGGQYYGPNWIGPTIMAYGTEEQKDKHLPTIAAGHGLWAQGYSEPDAGSDLASLQLHAERVDGGWELSGQKIWTSYAGYAEWIILLARTGSGPTKHAGITVFLLPMDREGIEVRPIKEVTGHHDFNEVFFDCAFAADDEVLGDVHEGWEIARASLQFERVGNPRWARVERLLTEAREVMTDRHDEPEPEQIDEWVRASIGCRVSRVLHYRSVAERERGVSSPLSSSVFRAYGTLNDQSTTTAVINCLGPTGWLGHGEDGVAMGGEAQHEWRLGMTATVAAGTYEVNQMVIAKEALAGHRD